MTALPHTIPVAMGARDALLYAALALLAAGLVAVRRFLGPSPLLPWAQAGVVLVAYLVLAAWVRRLWLNSVDLVEGDAAATRTVIRLRRVVEDRSRDGKQAAKP